MFFNIATQQTSKNQCKIKKYSQCSGFRSKHADFRSENAEYRSGLENTTHNAVFLFFWVPKQSNIWTCSILEWCMSSLLSYHIFSFFISNFFENFKSGRNFSKFTAGLCYRLLPVSVKIGGNRRLPIGKENTAHTTN